MNWPDWDKALLALVMWREACGEGREGMQAVGCVVRNRAAQGVPWALVMAKKWQFSSMTAPGDAMLVQWPTNGLAFETAMDLADGIYNKSIPDNTGGATHYRNPVTATSKSFQNMIDTGQLIKTVTIGRHDFYRPPHL